MTNLIHLQPAFMQAAIEAARASRALGDYAVGACVARADEVIAVAGNRTHLDEDPTAHAEMLAIRAAAARPGTKNLQDCVMYGTHEPCPMCAGAAVWARLAGVVWAVPMGEIAGYAALHGNDRWKWRTLAVPAASILRSGLPVVPFVEGFMREACSELFHS